MPTTEWVRNDGNLTDGRMVSDAIQNQNSAFVTARLRWLDGFLESDAGDYTCVVQGDSDTVFSKVVTLEARTEPSPTLAPPMCSVSSGAANFEVRVLNMDCLTWGEELKEDISRDFMSDLVNIASTTCQGCIRSSQDIMVVDVSCSGDGAALFSGAVDTGDPNRNSDIICALTQWQQSGPLVFVNGNYLLVDSSLQLLSTTTTPQTTTPLTTTMAPPDTPLAIIAGASAVGVVALLGLILVMACCCIMRSLRKQSEHQPQYIYDQ